jgi:type II secretory pathway pseudopilin PulG
MDLGRRVRDSGGFTLIELLVVIAIRESSLTSTQ